MKNFFKITLSWIFMFCISNAIVVSCRPQQSSENVLPPRALADAFYRETIQDESPDKLASVSKTTLSPKVQGQIDICEADSDLMELCMRCAKVTKAVIVYPMCCGDEDGVTQWCKDYVHFGLTY